MSSTSTHKQASTPAEMITPLQNDLLNVTLANTTSDSESPIEAGMHYSPTPLNHDEAPPESTHDDSAALSGETDAARQPEEPSGEPSGEQTRDASAMEERLKLIRSLEEANTRLEMDNQRLQEHNSQLEKDIMWLEAEKERLEGELRRLQEEMVCRWRFPGVITFHWKW